MYSCNSEIMGVIAALIAVLLAIFEVIFKFYGKNAERKTTFYAKYQYIYQQLHISTCSVKKFLEMAENEDTTIEELYGFAQAHMVSEVVFECIYDYQELAFICLTSKNNEDVKLALKFGGLAKSYAESINALFKSVFQSESGMSDSEDFIENIRSPRIQNIYEKMKAMLEQLKNVGESSESEFFSSQKRLSDIMYDTVKNQRRQGNCMRAIYLSLCVFLMTLCLIYVFYLHLGLKLIG